LLRPCVFARLFINTITHADGAGSVEEGQGKERRREGGKVDYGSIPGLWIDLGFWDLEVYDMSTVNGV
jgi:hypothetical protein